MREIQISAWIDGENIGQAIKTKGFSDVSEIERTIILIGVLDNMKKNMMDKLSNQHKSFKQPVKDN